MSDSVGKAIAELAERTSKARYKARRDLEALAKAPGSIGAIRGAESACLDAERSERALEAARRVTDPARTVALATGESGDDAVVRSRVAVRVGREPRTYEPTGEHSFVRDALHACRGRNHEPEAAERMARHHREMRIDGLIGAAEERALSGESGAGEAFLHPSTFRMKSWVQQGRHVRLSTISASKRFPSLG